MIINIYYPGEPVNIHIQSLINIIQLIITDYVATVGDMDSSFEI